MGTPSVLFLNKGIIEEVFVGYKDERFLREKLTRI
jgi:hypothetical protein